MPAFAISMSIGPNSSRSLSAAADIDFASCTSAGNAIALLPTASISRTTSSNDLSTPGDQANFRATARKFNRQPASDAGRGAGDHHDFVLEVIHGRGLQVQVRVPGCSDFVASLRLVIRSSSIGHEYERRKSRATLLTNRNFVTFRTRNSKLYLHHDRQDHRPAPGQFLNKPLQLDAHMFFKRLFVAAAFGAKRRQWLRQQLAARP